MFQYVTNGLGSSSALQRLIDSGMDPAVLRPWREVKADGVTPTGRNFITRVVRRSDGALVLNERGQPTFQNFLTNAPATLRLEDWRIVDRRVEFAKKQRLQFWRDLYAAQPYNIPNGMGTIAIQHAVATGDASAEISMDPIRRGERSRPTLDTGIIPLPVIHGDGSFSAREIAVSRNGQMPLDTTNIELTTRKVSEIVEGLSLGTVSSYSYAGGTIYGLTNHPNRFTKVMTTPVAGNGATTLAELLDMIKTLNDNFYYGPFTVYYSNNWTPWLAKDYTTAYPRTVLSRLQEGLPMVTRWQNLDLLTGYQMIVIQMTPDVAQGINGMDITPVQWEEQGGFEQCFKVLCINVPRFRADGLGKLGVNHGTAP